MNTLHNIHHHFRQRLPYIVVGTFLFGAGCYLILLMLDAVT